MFEDILDYTSNKKSKYDDVFLIGEIIGWDNKYVFIRYHDLDGLDYIIPYNGGYGENTRVLNRGDKLRIIFERKENGKRWFQSIYKKWTYVYWKKRMDNNLPIKEWEKPLRFVYVVTVEMV